MFKIISTDRIKPFAQPVRDADGNLLDGTNVRDAINAG